MIWSTLPIGLKIVGLPAGVIVNPRHSLMMDFELWYQIPGGQLPRLLCLCI